MLGGCGKSNKMQSFSGATMGTTYTVKVADNSDITQQQIDDKLKQINKTFSTWDAKSELSLLNKQPTKQWIGVSNELFYVLKKSEEIHQQTNGYFDPAIGRLIDIWGFGAKKVIQKPSRNMIYEALRNSSIDYLKFRDGQNKAIKKIKDIQINLSAIAKGYGVDVIAKLLNSKNYLVEIGGEVRSYGSNGDKPWTVGIEQPNSIKPITRILNNQAIATSGNYRNYFIWEGKRYMHILNPNNGLPANNDLYSVSVLHPQTMMADAYATAMMAMGSQSAITLAKRLKLPVILILNQQQNFKVVKINL